MLVIVLYSRSEKSLSKKLDHVSFKGPVVSYSCNVDDSRVGRKVRGEVLEETVLDGFDDYFLDVPVGIEVAFDFASCHRGRMKRYFVSNPLDEKGTI